MNGVLIIDKPAGLTSHDVIYRVRRILKIKAAGHTGTLDPFATGVLVVLVGRATRLAQFLDKSEKEYLAAIRFGYETTTGDKTGEAKELRITNYELRIGEIQNALAKFRGEIWQTPPMYSAKKIAGKKLYELARKNEEVERQPVKVNISKLQLVDENRLTTNNGLRTTDQLQILVAVSAGTYIRTLAEDIGRELGTGAHLTELRRTRAGHFDLSQVVTLEKLDELANENKIQQILISPNDALAHLPQIVLSEDRVQKTLNGLKTFVDLTFADNQLIRMIDEQENLIAVGAFNQTESLIQPRVVLATNEKS